MESNRCQCVVLSPKWAVDFRCQCACCRVVSGGRLSFKEGCRRYLLCLLASHAKWNDPKLCVCMFGWMNSMPQKSPLFANHWQQPSLVWVSSPFADKMGDKVACPNCNHSVLDTFAFKQQFISMVVLSFAIHVWTVYSLYISKHIPSFGRHLSLLVLIDGATKWLSSKPRRDSSVESCN